MKVNYTYGICINLDLNDLQQIHLKIATFFDSLEVFKH